uniref:Uncharacterized protein n=1 Tax=Zea mays TaxID=4577 RepID=B6U5I7_MAIZE|nr:hypothetical protein [Zea mays]
MPGPRASTSSGPRSALSFARRVPLLPHARAPCSKSSKVPPDPLPKSASSSISGASPQQQRASHGVCFPNARPVNSRDASSLATWTSFASCPRRAPRNPAASSNSDALRCVALARTGLTSSLYAASACRRRNPRSFNRSPCRRHASRIARRQRAQTNGMHARRESARLFALNDS